MTREEEIVLASKQHKKDSFLLGCHEDAFITGAEWADAHPVNVWHDASEEPKSNNCDILCQNTEGSCWVENMFVVSLNNTWNEYIDIEMVDKWAYIDDLLPKGGGR